MKRRARRIAEAARNANHARWALIYRARSWRNDGTAERAQFLREGIDDYFEACSSLERVVNEPKGGGS